MTFDIDANGIVNVTAKDKATNKEQAMQIQASGGLSKDDIEKMVKDAEANTAADKKRREAVDARNQADGLIHQVEKNLQEHGDKVEASVKSSIESDIASLRSVLDGDDAEPIKSATNTLMQSSMKLGEVMYQADQQAAAGDGASAGPGKSTDDDGVVDADFEEVNNPKSGG